VVADVQLCPRVEQPMEDGARLRVAEQRAGLGEQAHAKEPLLIEGQARNVVRYQLIEDPPRLRGPP
jgi:hypothetical protein